MKNTEKDRLKYLASYNSRANQNILFEEFISKEGQKRYSQRLFEMDALAEENTSGLEENDNQAANDTQLANDTDEVPSPIEQIEAGNFEKNNTENFKKSIYKSSRNEFLTPYSDDDFASMDTYKVIGYNIGFAIKSDGDIVSVHNNSGYSGIGIPLMKAAIKLGGKKLDHFDGFLTGFYKKLGFKVVGSEAWNDDYAPSSWKYTPINPFDPNTSAYAEVLNKYKNNLDQLPNNLKAVIERYKQGKPDIIYRAL